MRRRWVGFAMGAALALEAVLMSAVPVAAATQIIELQDDCDPTSFNAPPPAGVGPGTCVGSGETTFSEFIAELTEDKVVGAWEFSPDNTTVHRGDSLTAKNTGGETHSFTKVVSFGGGIVPFLNQLSGNPTLAVIAPGQGNTFVPAGRSFVVPSSRLTPGQNRFQCLIHPWMRSVVTVETD